MTCGSLMVIDKLIEDMGRLWCGSDYLYGKENCNLSGKADKRSSLIFYNQ